MMEGRRGHHSTNTTTPAAGQGCSVKQMVVRKRKRELRGKWRGSRSKSGEEKVIHRQQEGVTVVPAITLIFVTYPKGRYHVDYLPTHGQYPPCYSLW